MNHLNKLVIWIQNSSRRQETFLLFGVVIFSILSRIGFGFILHHIDKLPIYDEVFYDFSASKILLGEGYRSIYGITASKPPLYPFFLAVIYFLFGKNNIISARLVQIFLDSFTCILIYLLARIMSGKLSALVAGIVAAIYPLSIYMTSEIYPESLFLFVECLMLLVTVRMVVQEKRWYGFFGGALFGLCMLARPNIALFLPFILAFPFILKSKSAWKQVFQYTSAVVLVLIPWSIRNYLVFNSFVPLTTDAGAVFWSDNHPMANGGTVIPDENTWPGEDDPDRFWAGWSVLSEPENSRRFLLAGLQWVESHPLEYLKLIPMKLGRLWSPVAFTTQSDRPASPKRNLLWIPYLPFLAITIIGIFHSAKWWRKWWIFYGLILATNISTMIFSGGTRYSMPMVPALVLLFTQGILLILFLLLHGRVKFFEDPNVKPTVF